MKLKAKSFISDDSYTSIFKSNLRKIRLHSRNENGRDDVKEECESNLEVTFSLLWLLQLLCIYSRTSLFRTRLIRSPRYFEGRSNALGFTLPFTLPRLFRSRAISNFFSFPLGLRNSGVRLYLLNYDGDGGSESSRPLFLPFFSTSYWPFRNGADTGQALLVGVMVGGGGGRVATVILNCTMRLF